MSGSLLGGIIGAAIGFATGGPAGAYWGWAIGSAAGGLLLSHKGVETRSPTLTDLRPQSSEYGRPIPIIYGTVGLGGNVIWAADLIAVETTTQTDVGKGGGNTISSTSTAYYANFAVLVGEGELDVGRIWAGPEKRLIYDGTTLEGGTLRIYNGNETQVPDPLIEAALGVGNVPAYRGYCYLVFEKFPLHNDGNMIPFLTVEAGSRGGHPPLPVYLGNAAVPENGSAIVYATYDPVNRNVWSLEPHLFGSTVEVRVNSDTTQQQVKSFSVPVVGNNFTAFAISYIPPTTDKGGLIVATGESFGDFKDVSYIFSANDLSAATDIYVGPYHGTAVTEATLYNPVTKTLMGFRRGGQYTADILSETYDSFVASAFIQDGTGITFGIANPVGALTCGDNYATAWSWGGNSAIIIRSFANSSLIGSFISSVVLIPTQPYGWAYDSVRNRIVIAYGSNIKYDYINIGTLAVTTGVTVSLPSNADTIPAITTASMQGIAYINDTYVFTYSNASGSPAKGTAAVIVDPGSATADNAYSYEAYNAAKPRLLIAPILAPSTNADYIFVFDSTSVKRLYIRPALGGALLSDVVADISQRAGLDSSQYNVAALTDVVDGYAIAKQTTLRAAIEPLRQAYYFDAVESNTQVKFVKRGGATVATIPDSDLASVNSGDAIIDPLMTTRQMEVELPHRIYVTYMSAAINYDPGSKYAGRLIGSSGEDTTLDLPLVLTDTKAQEVSDVNIHVAWVQRLGYTFVLPKKYVYLEPTDPIVVKQHNMRIAKITKTAKGLLKIEAVAEDANYYTPHVIVTETPVIVGSVATPSATILELM